MRVTHDVSKFTEVPLAPHVVSFALQKLNVHYPMYFAQELADLLNQALRKREEGIALQLELQKAILTNLVQMVREPQSGMREECLRLDAIRAEKILSAAPPLPANPSDEFKSALHSQEAFKLNSDTIAAAKWGWYTALGGGEKQSWVSVAKGFPSNEFGEQIMDSIQVLLRFENAYRNPVVGWYNWIHEKWETPDGFVQNVSAWALLPEN